MHKQVGVGLGLAGLVVLATASAATALFVDNLVPNSNYTVICTHGSYSGNGSICQTDNATVSWYAQGSVTGYPSDYDAVKATINGSYDPTAALDFVYDSTPTYSGAGETDIIYQEGTISAGDNYVGFNYCDDPVDGSRYKCDQQYVGFKQTTSVDRSLACHETGHAVGLLHGVYSSPAVSNTTTDLACMITPHDPANQYLGSNNVTNIDNTY